MKVKKLVITLVATAAVFVVSNAMAGNGQGACDGSGSGQGKCEQKQTCSQNKNGDGSGAGQQAGKSGENDNGQKAQKRDGSCAE